MIGNESFLFELMPLLIPLVVLVVGIGIVVKGRRRLGLFFCGFAFVMWLLMGVRYFHQVRNHHFLAKLSIENVASVRIDKTTITNPASLRPIIQALNNRKWFSPNHGGWAEKVDLIVTLKSNKERRFWVGYYLREPGAVIQFYRGDKKRYWADGYAFSPDLSVALANGHVELPEQR